MITHISKAEFLQLVKKKPKYKNTLVRNALGQVENHSKKENQFAKDLYLELRSGKYKSVTEQVRMPLIVQGKHICDYIVDFLVVDAHDQETYIEVKGFLTESSRIKIALFKAIYPEKKLLVFR